MAHRLERGERELWNSLTILKLSLQVLERRTELSARQQKLVSSALTAADRLTTTLPLAHAPERLGSTNGYLSLAAADRPMRAAARVPFPVRLWRHVWPLGKRLVLGTTRIVLAPRLSGLRARSGPRRFGHSSRI